MKRVLDAIKDHATIRDVEICAIRHRETYAHSRFCYSSKRVGDEDEDDHPELRAYLGDEGEWTQALENEFGGD